MPYYDGFVAPVPLDGQDTFLAHARTMGAQFLEHGASRVVECWGDDVTHGKVTDFYMATQAKDGETVAFSWIEWPDKATRNRAWGAIMNNAAAQSPMPFDGKRMFFGGFEPLVTKGDHTTFPYVQGFMVPVPTAKREPYAKMAAEGWDMFIGHGALAVLEAWGDDLPRGDTTDFYRAVNATEEESVVFSYMIWPSRAVCQTAAKAMAEMQMPDGFDMPFDGMRMVWAGFEPVLVLEK